MLQSVAPTTPIKSNEYDILPSKVEDKEEIMNFLREFYFKDEPLHKYLGLETTERPLPYDPDNGLNLKAVCNGKIIGVSLNLLLERGYLEKDDHDYNISYPKFLKICRLARHIAHQSNIFARFPGCDKAMYVSILSVNEAFRGQGIAKELLCKTMQMAKKLGCGIVSVDCTSHFTALAVNKLGFQLLYSLKYADYKENGQVVFKPESPHEAVKVYAQKI